jgi:hypothetical protein
LARHLLNLSKKEPNIESWMFGNLLGQTRNQFLTRTSRLGRSSVGRSISFIQHVMVHNGKFADDLENQLTDVHHLIHLLSMKGWRCSQAVQAARTVPISGLSKKHNLYQPKISNTLPLITFLPSSNSTAIKSRKGMRTTTPSAVSIKTIDDLLFG